MSKADLVIFGNSPFLNQVDIPNLLLNYTTIGFNGFGQHHPVDRLFLFDRWYDPGKAALVLHPPQCRPPKPCAIAQAFEYKASNKPILPESQKNGRLLLGFKYFSPSVALNWALLKGFKRIYLVGIDHTESDIRFAHFDGADCRSELTPQAHQAFKQYVYECANHAEIHQTNPAVKDGWRLPFKSIESLYAPST